MATRLRRSEVIDRNRNYTLEYVAHITGSDTFYLMRRLRRYRNLFRSSQTGQIMLSGETLERVLTAKGVKWEYEEK